MGVSGSTALAMLIFVLGAAACGGADDAGPPQTNEPPAAATEPMDAEPGEGSDVESAEPGDEATKPGAAALARRPAGEQGLRVAATRARIVARESAFGRVLFDANGQVVYVFENDRRNQSNCTSEDCVEAWPPVLTRERPSAGPGVDVRLLGTIRRGDGSLQVTYDGRPLYFYEHEGPGEIKCHNVQLHGGLWWVITRQGTPAD